MTLLPPVKRLQTMLDDHVDNFGAVSIIAGIDLPGLDRIHVVAGRRERDGAKIEATHLYQIGSQTKTFVAIAILKLVKDGVIDLDAPVNQYASLPIEAGIKVRHLISNTSGIPEYLLILRRPLGDSLTPEDLVLPALAEERLFAPGDRYDYSNTSWAIAALVLDAVAPGGYANFVRDHIIKPLNMTDTYIATGYPEDRFAYGYMQFKDGQSVQGPTGFSLTRAYGAGDIISTSDDMIALYRALASPANAIGISFADMTARWRKPAALPSHPGTLGSSYAFGLERRTWGGHEIWGHPGRTVGCGASTWYVPATGAIATTGYMYIEDEGEPPMIAAQRYNSPLLFTEVLATAHALHDLTSAASQRETADAG